MCFSDSRRDIKTWQVSLQIAESLRFAGVVTSLEQIKKFVAVVNELHPQLPEFTRSGVFKFLPGSDSFTLGLFQ